MKIKSDWGRQLAGQQKDGNQKVKASYNTFKSKSTEVSFLKVI